ncbi:hypothetical protein [Gordonia terrae]|uniref:hypothetical protein n=1 Tax=Gordonia terrae TaxID=2055 RepID=UPI0012694849|nr:hypothetical protein [Gordonia terrae]
MTSYKDINGLITGSVAKVRSKRAVVINRGLLHGVQLGQRFQILSKDGDEIKDPETGDVIETIPYEKARVEVEELYENAAVAKTYGTHFTGGSAFTSPTVADLFGPRREVFDTFPAEINSDEGDDRDMTVRAGDRVREIQESSAE